MERRCVSDKCIIKAAGHNRHSSLDLSLANVLIDPCNDWKRLSNGKVRIARDIQVDWKQFNQDKYIFSHSTIISSVAVEDNGYHINPVCSSLVNNNGNAWTNSVLLATFRSFVGGENYLEHVQVPELSKGKILDAVIRPISYKSPKVAGTANVYYVDLLIATERRHEKLCRLIASGEMNSMSMGCIASWVQCSRCGVVLGDDDKNCNCIDHGLLQTFKDNNGIERVTAELCGRSMKDDNGVWVGDPESVNFIEASWVERPAFTGAVLNHFLSELPKSASSILDFPTHKLADTMEELFRMRVADVRGMMTLRVAIEEMNRRKRIDMASRIAKTFWS